MTRYTKFTLLVSLMCAICCSACSTDRLIVSPNNLSTEPVNVTPVTHSTSTSEARKPDDSCWPVTSSMQNIKGSFVFQTKDSGGNIFARDLSSSNTQSIGSFNGILENRTFSISSNGNILAGLSSNNQVVIISSDQIRSYPVSSRTRGSVVEYLTDQRIRIPVSEENLSDNYKENIGFTDEYYLLNPVTGELTTHSVFLPNYWMNLHKILFIRYSPDLHYVVYQTIDNDRKPVYALFDLQNNRVIWTGPETQAGIKGDPGSMPIWMPDSSALTYYFTGETGENGNYYTISKDGELSSLTSFEKTKLMGLGRGWLANPSWSPDGRYLVFRAVSDNSKGLVRLLIWDNQEKVARIPCLPDENQIDIGYEINWSFDGTCFLLTLGYPNNHEGEPIYSQYQRIIVDLSSQTMIELPVDDTSNDIYLGWINWEIP